MIVIRSILGVIGALTVCAVFVAVLPVMGLITLYRGIVDHDWCEDVWTDVADTIKGAKDGLMTVKEFILNG